MKKWLKTGFMFQEVCFEIGFESTERVDVMDVWWEGILEVRREAEGSSVLRRFRA